MLQVGWLSVQAELCPFWEQSRDGSISDIVGHENMLRLIAGCKRGEPGCDSCWVLHELRFQHDSKGPSTETSCQTI